MLLRPLINRNILFGILQKRVGGADVVSKGELKAIRKNGIPPGKIVFSGVGKPKRK